MRPHERHPWVRPWLSGSVSAIIATSGLVVWTGVTGAPRAAAAEPVVVVASDFDDGVDGWGRRADETVATSTAIARTGSASLAITGRTRSWEGPALDLLGTLEGGVRYTFSVWVRQAAGVPATDMRMSVERRLAGTANYDQVVGNTSVGNGGWTQLTGAYTLATAADFLTVYVESASGTGAFHIDDFTVSYLPASPIQTDIPALKTVLANDFAIGAAIARPQILGEHGQLLNRHFNSVTPENALKWDATQPVEGQFRYTDADALIAYANANGMQVRGHTLVWHQQTPAWVFQTATGAPLTSSAEHKALLLRRLEDHIRAVAGRYATDIDAWDVVNEVIDENQADGLRRSTWYTISGLDFIRTAFRVARQVAPSAKLFINDYNTNVPAKRDKLFNLVSQLRAEGVPVDGVGHQMHVHVDWPSVSETEQMINRFVPLGVDQQITEMDVSIYTNNGESFPTPPASRLIRQGERYRDLFALYRRHRADISSVTVWGLADDHTWLDTFPVNRKDAPLFFDTQLQAKSAYWGVVDPTRISPSPSTSVSPSSSASARPSPSTSVSPSRTVSPTPTGVASCRVGYVLAGQWPGGFQGEVRVTNTGAAAVNGWTLRWAFPGGQQVTQLWGGGHSQNGAQATVTNLSWNAQIAPGATVTFGFLASWQGANPAPTAFTLNDRPCTVG